MLLEGGVDGHLNPIHCSRCDVCLLGPRKNEIAHLEVLIFPKMTSVPLSVGGRKSKEMTYKLAGLEAKSIRLRCIRVAAIIIVIREGVSII
jgi:hypothetical protein